MRSQSMFQKIKLQLLLIALLSMIVLQFQTLQHGRLIKRHHSYACALMRQSMESSSLSQHSHLTNFQRIALLFVIWVQILEHVKFHGIKLLWFMQEHKRILEQLGAQLWLSEKICLDTQNQIAQHFVIGHVLKNLQIPTTILQQYTQCT